MAGIAADVVGSGMRRRSLGAVVALGTVASLYVMLLMATLAAPNAVRRRGGIGPVAVGAGHRLVAVVPEPNYAG